MSMDISKMLEEFDRTLPHFSDGRIDYSASQKALVLTCFPAYANEILILKRSEKVGTYRGIWNAVAGYIDENKPLKEKIMEEISEELGIPINTIEEIKIGKTYEFTDEEINRTWIVIPSLAMLQMKPEIKLDWEHTDCKWIKPEKMCDFSLVPMLEKSFKNINL